MPDIFKAENPAWKKRLPHSYGGRATLTRRRAPRAVFPADRRRVEPRVWAQPPACALVW